jgi:AraC-like DNA-binding protein/mannose-6-phosphate isomerase-like protein (cupin superfamily)
MKHWCNTHRPDSPERTHYIPSSVVEVSFYPKLLYTGRLERSPQFNETLHSHPFLEVLLINSGTGTVIIDEKSFQVKRGDVIVYNAGKKHMEISSLDDPLEALFFGAGNILNSGFPENTLPMEEETPVISSGDDFPLFQFYFSCLIRESQNKQHYTKETTESLTRLILVSLLRLLPFEEKNLQNNSIYFQAKKYIDEYYVQIKSIGEVCKSLRISNYYLIHIFRRYGDISPMQYVIKKRMELARSLLILTNLSIGDIALRCGYDDEYYFYRVFKKHTETTPSKYRESGIQNIAYRRNVTYMDLSMENHTR